MEGLRRHPSSLESFAVRDRSHSERNVRKIESVCREDRLAYLPQHTPRYVHFEREIVQH